MKNQKSVASLGLQVITKKEMKNIVGGVMDRETTLQWCYDQVDNASFDISDPDEYTIFTNTGYNLCYSAYLRMTS